MPLSARFSNFVFSCKHKLDISFSIYVVPPSVQDVFQLKVPSFLRFDKIWVESFIMKDETCIWDIFHVEKALGLMHFSHVSFGF